MDDPAHKKNEERHRDVARATRREFLVSAAAVAATAAIPSRVFATPPALYPPTDLSYFERPITPADAALEFGYAAITWQGNELQAIEDIASLGFPGIQLRSPAIAEFHSSPAEVSELLAQHHLKMVALSSGNLSIDHPAADELALHTAHAEFVRDAGGLYLQVICERPKGRTATPDDYTRMGRLLTELGKRTADRGIPLAVHHHMSSLAERPEETESIFAAADERYVKLLLDVAHWLQSGGDPVKALEQYRSRLLFLHLKDVITLEGAEAAAAGRNYRFVELGRGRVDLPGVFAAIKRIQYRGWAVVELDAPPDKSHTARECGEINKRYLEEKAGYTI